MSTQPANHELVWTDENLGRFWSYYAAQPHLYFAEAMGPAIVARAARWIRRDGVCLDYGCGTDGLFEALLAAGYRTAGFDLSADAVRSVRRRFADCLKFLGAWQAESAEAESAAAADTLFSIETIEHVTESHLTSYFAGIHAHLHPNGIASFTTPNREDIRAAMVYCPESGALFHPVQHVRRFDRDSLSALIRAAGFELLDVFETDFGAHLARNMHAHPPHLVAVPRSAR